MKMSYCYSHLRNERAGDHPYRVCGECGHVYRTRDALVDAYNREAQKMATHWSEMLAGDTAPVLRVLTVERADTIGFCQECLHGW